MKDDRALHFKWRIVRYDCHHVNKQRKTQALDCKYKYCIARIKCQYALKASAVLSFPSSFVVSFTQ